MKKYIQSISALNELTLSLVPSDEVERYAEADIFWARNKTKALLNRKIIKGNIYQFEFGKNFIPEMSYEHRGLVIGGAGKLLYVLPICSYNEKKDDHKDAYHPTDNPKSRSNYFLLKATEFPFLKHNSVLKLNDIRTVSFARIKYKQENGFIDPSSDVYKAIERLVIVKYFPTYARECEHMMSENERLKGEKTTIEEEKSKLAEQMESIKKMVVEHGFDELSQKYISEMFDLK